MNVFGDILNQHPVGSGRIGFGPPISLPRHYPHIRVVMDAGSNVFSSSDDNLLRNSIDVIFNEDVSAASHIHSVVPNTPQMIYTNVQNIYLFVFLDWLNYADAHGVSREAGFYHVASAYSSSGAGGSTQPVTWFWEVLVGTPPSSFTDLTGNAPGPGFSFGGTGQGTYLGYSDRFREIDVVVSTAPSGGWSYAFEYPSAIDGSGNPTTWSTLPVLSDTTSSLAHSGTITFNPPSNWVANQFEGGYRLFYLRFRTTSSSGTPPAVSSILSADYVGAAGGSSWTIPAFDYSADLDGDGYLNATEYASRAAGKNAYFAYQGRMFDKYGQMRFLTLVSNPSFRDWAAVFNRSYLDSNPLASGLFWDNAYVVPDNYISQANVIESIATYENDVAGCMTRLNAAITPKWIIPGIAGSNPSTLLYYNPAWFCETLLRPDSKPWPDFESVAAQVAGWNVQATPAPWGMIDSQVLNLDPASSRAQLATLSEYLMMADPDRNFIFFFGDNSNCPPFSDHWVAAVTRDLGPPTAAYSVFATGPDPGNTGFTYKVYQRSYAGALVLYKPLSFLDYSHTASIASNTATTHSLGGTYYPLNADATVGSGVTTVSLMNAQGAILLKTNPMVGGPFNISPMNAKWIDD